MGLFCEAAIKIPSWLVSFPHYPSEHRLSIASLSRGPLYHSINQRIFFPLNVSKYLQCTPLEKQSFYNNVFQKMFQKQSDASLQKLSSSKIAYQGFKRKYSPPSHLTIPNQHWLFSQFIKPVVQKFHFKVNYLEQFELKGEFSKPSQEHELIVRRSHFSCAEYQSKTSH